MGRRDPGRFAAKHHQTPRLPTASMPTMADTLSKFRPHETVEHTKMRTTGLVTQNSCTTSLRKLRHATEGQLELRIVEQRLVEIAEFELIRPWMHTNRSTHQHKYNPGECQAANCRKGQDAYCKRGPTYHYDFSTQWGWCAPLMERKQPPLDMVWGARLASCTLTFFERRPHTHTI